MGMPVRLGLKSATARWAKAWSDDMRVFAWTMYGPAVGFLVAIVIFPLFFSLIVSFSDYTLHTFNGMVGISNYKGLLLSGEFWQSLALTFKIALLALPLELGLGLLLAILLTQRFPLAGLWRMLVFLPMMLSPLLVGLYWRFLFDQGFGLIGWLFTLFGAEVAPSWLTDSNRALAAIVIVDVWQWTPFVVLLMIAGLQTVPVEVHEAASLADAPWWMRFRRITLPYLRPALTLAILFRSIDTLKMFDLPYILTGGGPGNSTQTLSLQAYRLGFVFFQQGKAAALSWLFLIMLNVIMIFLLRALSRRRTTRPVPAEVQPEIATSLGQIGG